MFASSLIKRFRCLGVCKPMPKNRMATITDGRVVGTKFVESSTVHQPATIRPATVHQLSSDNKNDDETSELDEEIESVLEELAEAKENMEKKVEKESGHAMYGCRLAGVAVYQQMNKCVQRDLSHTPHSALQLAQGLNSIGDTEIASEAVWLAAVLALKKFARNSVGIGLSSHTLMRRFSKTFFKEELQDRLSFKNKLELSWKAADECHCDGFYENDVTKEQLSVNIQHVRFFIDNLPTFQIDKVEELKKFQKNHPVKNAKKKTD